VDKKIHSIRKIMVTFLNKESLTTKLTLIIVGLTAGSGLLIPATFASFHPVTSGEIADNTIRSVDIENGQVTSIDIGTGQVRSEDILDGTITSADLDSRAVQVTRVEGINVTLDPGEFDSSTADCPAGETVTGGGFSTGAFQMRWVANYPLDANTWEVSALNEGSGQAVFSAYALCV
jgi:hypothetical protein